MIDLQKGRLKGIKTCRDEERKSRSGGKHGQRKPNSWQRKCAETVPVHPAFHARAIEGTINKNKHWVLKKMIHPITPEPRAQITFKVCYQNAHIEDWSSMTMLCLAL